MNDEPPFVAAATPSQQQTRSTTNNFCGVSALLYACQQGDVEKVRRILRAQPNSHFEKDRTGKTALHYCCTSDYITGSQAADVLLMAAPDLIDSRDEDGFTPLHLAVIAGNMSLVTFLLANNASVHAVDNEKHTVVHWATVCGETMALRAVLAAGAPVSTPDVHGGFPLHYASQMCGGEKDAELGLQVLHTLLTHQNVIVSVEDGDGRQPLLWASSAGSAKAVLALVRAGAAIEAHDKDGLTALHCAASRGHTDTIDSLLTLCGASPDVIDSNGCTALHYAVTLGHADATALLLTHAADPNKQDRKGRSPAHCGCAKGQLETVKMLGNSGANLWLRNAKGDLPLHEAAASGRRELVKWLLESRPSYVNARNNDGRCPIHLAALNDNADMCKILLDAGAQVNPVLRTSKNVFMTPLDCALLRGFRSTAKYLQLHGGIPANRLGNLPHTTTTINSAVSLHIRDDVTLWGESSSENDEFIRERSKKTQSKRKLTTLSEKKAGKKDSEFSVKIESNQELRNNTKQNGEIFIYANEVNINDLLRAVRVEHNHEIIVEPNTGNIENAIKSVTSERTRPKSAKYSSSKKQSKTTETFHETSNNTVANKTVVEVDQRQSNDNVALKSAENQAHSACTDQQSVISTTSHEDEESSRQLVVEASVHVPPTYNKSPVLVDSSVNTSPTEELPSTKEIGTTTADLVIEPLEKQVTYVEVAIQSNDHQSGDSLRSRETPFPVSLNKNVLSELNTNTQKTEHQEHDTSLTTDNTFELENSNMQQSIPETSVIIPQSYSCSVNSDVRKSPDFQLQNKTSLKFNTSNLENQVSKSSITDGTSIIVSPPTPENISENLLELAVTLDECHLIENVNKHSEDLTPTIAAKVENPIISEKKSNLIDNTTPVIISPLTAENLKNNSLELGPTSFFKDKPINTVSEDQSLANISNCTESLKKTVTITNNKEHVCVDNKLNDLPTQKGTDVPSDKKPLGKKKIDDKHSTITNTEHSKLFGNEKNNLAKKDKDALITPQTPHDSSIEAKSSSDEDTSRCSTPSSYLTSPNEHKSFKVLDMREGESIWANQQKTSSCRLSSRSEKPKTSSSMHKRCEKLARSKIPTPLGIKNALSKSDKHLDRYEKNIKMEPRVPSLPNIHASTDIRFKHSRSVSNMSAPMMPANYSDAEGETGSDRNEVSSATKKKRLRKRSKTRSAKSAGSDYESSNLIDSGFEPSPRSTKIPKWRNMSDRGVVMTSVTQTIQSNIRRYQLERKIFQHLLDLKRLQIRSGQHNEHVLVKRAIEAYHKSCAATVGAGRYTSQDLSFKAFEGFLYRSLRKIQRNGSEHLQGLPETPRNPLFCTQSTHRCDHAVHAYTGVPCAAYLPKMNHHTIPKIGFDCKPLGFLPKITNKTAVTLELCQGNDKQLISLPAERLDQNKRYYVTFTVKDKDGSSTVRLEENEKLNSNSHVHSRSD